ncbi:MAG: hypothetical protein ACOX69_01345 [Coriobacteriales bacterium]
MGCGAFCSYCGRCGRDPRDAIKWKVCRRCDFKNPVDVDVCQNCGAPLVTTFVSAVPKPKDPPPPGVS